MLVLTTKERANTIPSVCSIKPPSDLKTEPHGHHQPDRQLSIPLALHTSITQSDADFYHSSCEVLLGCQGIEKKMVRVAFSFVGQLRADSVRYRQAYTWQHTGNGCSATRSSLRALTFPLTCHGEAVAAYRISYTLQQDTTQTVRRLIGAWPHWPEFV